MHREAMIRTGARRPLVVIRFDRANVPYEQALYTAVSRALERRPQALFDLVAVAHAVLSLMGRQRQEVIRHQGVSASV